MIDPEIFAELRDLIGTEGMVAWLDGLRGSLNAVLAEGGEPTERLFHRAHELGGRAGVMGFPEVMQAASALQQACRSGNQIEPARRRLRSAAERAAGMIRLLRTDAL